MEVTKQLDQFRSRYTDLIDSLILYDFAIKHNESELLKNYPEIKINLARSILNKNVIVSFYECFMAYALSIINDAIETKVSKYIDSEENNMQLFNAFYPEFKATEITVFDLLTKPTNRVLKDKLKMIFNDKDKSETFVSALEKLFFFRFEGEIRELLILFMHMRHRFVHNLGYEDEKWIKKNSNILRKNDIILKDKNGRRRFPTNFKTIKLALDTYMKAAELIDFNYLREIKTPTEAGVQE